MSSNKVYAPQIQVYTTYKQNSLLSQTNITKCKLHINNILKNNQKFQCLKITKNSLIFLRFFGLF